jgi:hypothetical protein
MALALAGLFVALRWYAAQRLGESREAQVSKAFMAAALAGLWLVATRTLAESGLIAEFDRRPPPMAFLFIALLIVSALLAYGPIGSALVAGLPLWVLVASQSFRLPLELAMHQAAVEGVMPNQMSYSGANFDTVTGASAIVVSWLLATGRAGRRLAAAWNVLGALLLVNILTIALASLPMFAAFGPDRLNTWVAHPPFIWLPTVMVVAAIAGHLMVWRKLRVTG